MPQSGELIHGRGRIAEAESPFVGLRLGVGRRRVVGDTVVVKWSTDDGDGQMYRNVSIAELRNGKAVRVTTTGVSRWRHPPGASRWRRS